MQWLQLTFALIFFIFVSTCTCSTENPTVSVHSSGRELWDLKLKIHQEVEGALSTPLNLFVLKETFYPREEGVSPPLSVTVSYKCNLTRSLSTADEEYENKSFSFLWSKLPLARIEGDCLTFRLLNTYSQPELEPMDVIPHIELDLELKDLPVKTTNLLLYKELYGISKMVCKFSYTNTKQCDNMCAQLLFSCKNMLLCTLLGHKVPLQEPPRKA